jgi:hypothetical protein
LFFPTYLNNQPGQKKPNGQRDREKREKLEAKLNPVAPVKVTCA